jgi:hypothetical protein
MTVGVALRKVYSQTERAKPVPLAIQKLRERGLDGRGARLRERSPCTPLFGRESGGGSRPGKRGRLPVSLRGCRETASERDAEFGQPLLDVAARLSNRPREVVVHPILARFEPRNDSMTGFQQPLEAFDLSVHGGDDAASAAAETARSRLGEASRRELADSAGEWISRSHSASYAQPGPSPCRSWRRTCSKKKLAPRTPSA